MIKRRNKKPKKIRRKKRERPIVHLWGGHLPHPPKDCKRKEKVFKHQGVYWIDLSLCHECHHLLECTRRKEYLKEQKHARREKIRKGGTK